MDEPTINDAIKDLPPGTGERIKLLFREVNSMDLYGGILNTYLDVIHQNMVRLKARVDILETTNDKILEMLECD